MATFSEKLQFVPGLRSKDVDWLHMLVGDWQLIADLAIGDLVLWGLARDEGQVCQGGFDQAADEAALLAGRRPEGTKWTVLAHVRPNTGPLVFYDDLVGDQANEASTLMLDQAVAARAIVTAGQWPHSVLRRVEATPVVHRGAAIAVVTRHQSVAQVRAASQLERVYQATADTLMGMIRDGGFPLSGQPKSQRHGTPRAGDGVIRIDNDGVIEYLSPNATSALLRLGHEGPLKGAYLSKVVIDLLQGHTIVDETLPLVTMGRAAWRTDVEADGGVMAMRAVPLRQGKERLGALILVRDISELRRQEEQLLTKDATIREIHHRVKNNLQTVAALLRLQARRVTDTSAQASLAEAGRRVSTIALVHETLSRSLDESVGFDEIATRVINAILEVAGGTVSWSRQGSFGHLDAAEATPMALVLAELVQNTVDHAFGPDGGHVVLSVAEADAGVLRVDIFDDGVGLPEGFKPGRSGLGTQIVRAFVQDLRGKITWEARPEGGTKVTFTARKRLTAHSRAG
ncbi:Probable sensor histidine kinase pdtaS [Dermatophilus congolensis]|uniref:histidine kinase n=1 Tax=Dermatophilus congolensis TaxID=1863 RepID=A0AA46H000_9MICO|nr:histidine kinase N-terminal domain-containing protein [Dermatophilus congolensis]STD06854.1 Probable sensor histidine kinase pdtaS [Dermatophilus congolensis]